MELEVYDKDGTLVRTKSGDTFPKLGDQELIPGVKERIAASAAAGKIIAVASNQAGIPKYKSLEDAIAEFQELMQLLPEISVCFFCPDFSGSHCWSVPNPESPIWVRDTLNDVTYPAGKSKDYCNAKPLHDGLGAALDYGNLIGSFRKPNPGMLNAAMLWAGVDTCTYTGDRPEDRAAAAAAGVPYQYVSEWLLDYDDQHGGEWNYQVLVTTPDYVRVKTYVYALNQIEAEAIAKRSASALLNSGQEIDEASEWKAELLPTP